MSRIKRILVPTDFSPTAEIALQYAIDLAPAGASIHVIHVVDDTGLLATYPDGMYVDLAALRADLVIEAQKRLIEAVRKVPAEHATVSTEAFVGRPVAAIVEAAKMRKADLIVMGTHGRGALAHLVLGSVAERIVRTAQCPVLTVRDNSRAADAIADELMAHRQAAHM